MPTLVRSYIASNGINPGGYDHVFTSLENWWNDAAISGDIVGRDEVHEAHVKGEDFNCAGGAIVTMGTDDAIVDATHFYTIQAENGAEFTGDFSAVSGVARFFNFSPYGFQIIQQYTVIKGFFLHDSACLWAINLGESDCTATGNGIYNLTDASDSGLCVGIYIQGNRNLVANNVIAGLTVVENAIDFEKTCFAFGVIFGDSFTGNIAHNNIIRAVNAESTSPLVMGIQASGFITGTMNSTNHLHNNIVFGVTSATGTADDYSIVGGTVDHNASEDGTGSVTGITAVANFVDPVLSTFNAHLLSTAPLRSGGLDVSGLSRFLADDIDEDAYGSIWPFGVDMIPPIVADCGSNLGLDCGASYEPFNTPLGPVMVIRRRLGRRIITFPYHY